MAQIKVFSCWCLLFLIPTHLSSQSEQAIDVKEAYKYVGDTKIVCGKIVSTKYLKRASGGPIFLNFGRDYPNQQMTGGICQSGGTYYRQSNVERRSHPFGWRDPYGAAVNPSDARYRAPSRNSWNRVDRRQLDSIVFASWLGCASLGS